MRRRSIFTTAAVVTGLGLGAAFGPAVRDSTASAQTQPPAQTQTAQLAAPKADLRNLFLDKLAVALNIQRSALDTAMVTAATSTVDEQVKQGQLTQAQADQLKARIQSGDLGGFAFGGGRGGQRGGATHQAMFDAAANTLGITSAELKSELRGGQTIAQLAQAHNTTEQAVIDAALAAAKAQLDQQVAAGSLTRQQADEMYARLQQSGTQLFNHPGRGPGGRGGSPAAPTTPQAPSTTTGA